MTCTVVCDEASSVVASVISLADDALSDVTTAFSFAAAAGIDLSDTQSALGAPDAALKGTASYTSALNTLASASALVASGISQAEWALGSVSWTTDGQISFTAGTFGSMVSAAQQISSLTLAEAYIGRATINLVNAST